MDDADRLEELALDQELKWRDRSETASAKSPFAVSSRFANLAICDASQGPVGVAGGLMAASHSVANHASGAIGALTRLRGGV
jgi:hypothetical protein